ncbi:hypothetical protein [Rhodoglobus aureus]|uniref:hypothetical protein n=1 Tax=Rhodoglobus aureus TaxID=191497 RepID=UPI0031DD5306
MGAWGTGIFANDTAADIRSEYREHLEDRVPDAEATRLVIESFAHLQPNDRGELWIALAAAQTQVGRLDSEVKAAALAAIDHGAGLELWADAGSPALAKRVAALQKLRDQLTGPQPAPKKLRPPWRHEETELVAGDVLAYTATNSRMARLKPIHAPATVSMPERPIIYNVTRFRKSDLGWQECGFVHIARLPNWRSEDSLPNHFSAGRLAGLEPSNREASRPGLIVPTVVHYVCRDCSLTDSGMRVVSPATRLCRARQPNPTRAPKRSR